MTVRRGRSWAIVALATCILVVSLSASGSAKFRKPRWWSIAKIPYQHSKPMIVRVTDELLDDKPAPYSASPDCTGHTCRNARVIPDLGEMRSSPNDLAPSERYVVYPKQYERFVSRKSPGHRANRYKRYVAFPETPLPNATDCLTVGRPVDASQTSSNGDKLSRVPLYRTHRHVETQLAARTRRSFAADENYPTRRNASDYYAERRAVMARFYARQREIEARYGNRTNSSSNPEHGAPRNNPVTSNVTLFRLYPAKNSSSTDNGETFRHPSIAIDPVYNNLPAKPDGRPVVPETDGRFGLRARDNSNVERQAVRYYYTTPAPCANASLSGTIAPKKRSKNANDVGSDEDDYRTTTVSGRRDDDRGSDYEAWGECKGKVVYQHNLLLGLKGPSTLDTIFEVIIQGPICITCVEALRYNETRANVTYESGGRGHDYVKLKLQGYENEGFSYIIKVWGIRKFGQDCNMD